MTSLSIATNTSQQLFISIRGYLLLMGSTDDHELLLYDPGIKSLLKSYSETNKFGRNKLGYSPLLGRDLLMQRTSSPSPRARVS